MVVGKLGQNESFDAISRSDLNTTLGYEVCTALYLFLSTSWQNTWVDLTLRGAFISLNGLGGLGTHLSMVLPSAILLSISPSSPKYHLLRC